MTKTMTCDKCNGRGYFDFPQYGPSYAGVTIMRCEVCQGKGTVDVPITNADHIRSMSDEELAKFIADKLPHGDCYGCPWFYDCFCDSETCGDNFLNWLKQPWKETK